METIPPADARTPGVVIFVSILNFISASFAGLVVFVALLGLVFGNVMGLVDMLARQLSNLQQTTSVTYGVNFALILILLTSAVFLAFFLSIAIGLMRARRYAWYTQVAMSIVGLVGFPVGTILNGVILYLFFQPRVRDWFKV